jgi:Mg2+-importing ATPase
LVIFVIRTTGRAWRSRPSRSLVASTVLVVAVGMILPYTRAASWLGFEPLPSTFAVFLVLVVGSYLGIVEAVKRALLGRLQANRRSTGHLPDEQSVPSIATRSL